MSSKTLNVPLKPNSLSRERLRRLKWSTIIAIVGLPVMAQILGAMMLFSQSSPPLASPPALLIFWLASSIVIAAGLYALTTRVSLRFSGAHRGLYEWEAKVQSDAHAFSYRVIARGILLAFLCVSALGAFQLFSLLGWIDFDLAHSIGLSMPGIAALTTILTYMVVLLPTLFIAWTVNPVSGDDGDS